MSYHLDDTIAAVASAAGGAARGIVRLSGPSAIACLNGFRPANSTPLKDVKQPTAVPGDYFLADIASSLPCLLYWWPDSRSYTRQPLAEIHTLGSPPLLEALLRALCVAGARLAAPGEFTLRAFLCGRLDLAQAEAVLGVIDADDRHSLKAALRQLAGGISKPLLQLRDNLLDLLAHLEAGLDFVEEDIEFVTTDELLQQLTSAQSVVTDLTRQMDSRGNSHAPARVTLIGWPNAGKSSLFNALAGRSQAIVSPEAGTTRDYLIADLDLGGVRCQLVDTAGIEPDLIDESLSSAAQQLSAEQHRTTDIHLLCLDGARPLNAWEQTIVSSPPPCDRLVVVTKTDLASPACDLEFQALQVSSRSGAGLDLLRNRLRQLVAASSATDSSVVENTAARCQDSLRQTAESLDHAVELVRRGAGEELLAAEIRNALTELGKVTGSIYTDDILDRIFSRFCIGK